MFDFKKLVIKNLKETIERIESGNCELSDEEAMDILKVIAHRSLSKTQACQYLNISPSRFDDYIRMKALPKGRKLVGYKELRWYEDELTLGIEKLRSKK